LALALAAVQLLPTARLAEDSSRAELGYDYATSFGFSPYFLAAAFVPRGQIRLPGQEDAAPLHFYVGIGTLLLAAIGLLLSENRWRSFFAAVALVALFLSFGRDSPLFDWFYAIVPGFSRFRVPFRLLGLYTFGMAVLAGLGISVLEQARRKTRLRLRAVAKGALVVLLFLAGWTAYVHTSLASPGAMNPAQAERIVGGAYWALLLGTIHWLLLVIVVWRPRDRWAVAAMVAVAVVDLGAFVKDRGERPYTTLARAGDRPVYRLLRSQGYRSRYVTESNLQNYAMLHGVDFAGGHAALVDERYAELLDAGRTSANVLALLNAKFIVKNRPLSRFPWCGGRYASPLPLLDVSDDSGPLTLRVVPPVRASHFRLDWEPLGPGGRASIALGGKVFELEPDRALDVQLAEPERIESFTVSISRGSPGIRIQDVELDLNPLGLRADFLVLNRIAINLHALPRAYFMVPSTAPSKLQTLEDLRCWSIHQGVQVQDPETGEGASGFFRKNAVRITASAPERVEIETRSTRAGFVVLADTFRPGWFADVDGVDAPILRAQWSMRAVAVPEGEHKVRFRYEPASLATGTIVSGAASIIVLLLFVLGRVSKVLIKRTRQKLSAPDEDFVAGEGSDDQTA